METWVVEYYYFAFTWLNHWAAVGVQRLVVACLSGGIFIGCVWFVCLLIPRLPLATRCWLWWLACLKLLVGLIWTTPVDLPVVSALHFVKVSLTPDKPGFPPAPASAAAAVYTSPPSPAGYAPLQTGKTAAPIFPAAPGGENSLQEEEWQQPDFASVRHPLPPLDVHPSLAFGLIAVWAVGVTLACNRMERRLRRLRGLLRRSEGEVPVAGRALAVEVTRLLRLRHPPRLLISSETVSPLVTGLLRPTVILPAPAAVPMTSAETRMVLTHELAHVKRGDLWLA